jgi:DNA gyrase subunit A
MATRAGVIKKTRLSAYGRPKKKGIIAIKLREGDELIDVVVAKKGDDLVLATAVGKAIRFNEGDARPMGRNTSGVKGIDLTENDRVVGMVVAAEDATLLTACENGYGKRTAFGPAIAEAEVGDEDELSGTARYRRQRRGGKGLIDIKTVERNGAVIGVVPVRDEDHLLMMTARGKIQRIKCHTVSIIGRNTMGVRIMTLDEGDTLAAIVKVPPDENSEGPAEGPAG